MHTVRLPGEASSAARASAGGMVGGPVGPGVGVTAALGKFVGPAVAEALDAGLCGATPSVVAGAGVDVEVVGCGGELPQAAASAAHATRYSSAPPPRLTESRITLRSVRAPLSF